jgi:hypothetical protein
MAAEPPTLLARGLIWRLLLAACAPRPLLPSRPSCPSRPSLLFTMALDEAIDILKVLVPIAKAVPILGAPVEGSLEALSKVLEFAQVRNSPAGQASPSSADHETGSEGYSEKDGGACRSGRSLAEHRTRCAKGSRAQSGSLRTRGTAA